MTLDLSKIDWTATGALLALCISIASPSISFYVAWRDRARLKLSAERLKSALEIAIVNAGRRPIVIRMIGVVMGNTFAFCTVLEPERGGVRLQEHERYEYTITGIDFLKWPRIVKEIPGAEVFTLWVEDTLGNRYRVPDSQEKLKAVVKEWAVETPGTYGELAAVVHKEAFSITRTDVRGQ